MKIHTNKNLSFIYKRNIFIYSLLGLCFLFFNFNKAYADVYINEIAWMGDSVSSTNEWLELYNDGTIDVDLEGWSIVSEDGSPNISINGAANSIIGSKKYYLIERTDDTTVPNVTADFVTAFGSGLSNSGEKIFLKKPDGTIVETLDFKTGWPAGVNTTKQT
ncbi:MAG: lamin tail domain-containing protein, partial [Minisyncoccia bacterium]